MRLDLFLKASRLVLRRSIAQQMCDAGRVKVNEAKAKPSKEVKPGDVIEITRGDKRMLVRVVQLPASKQVSKQAAGTLVEVLRSGNISDGLLS
jgi:ribosomal 50S subunit-recycling heat shock protein